MMHSRLMAIGSIAFALTAGATRAVAVPSFSRQTGLACSACHITFPELTPFGRAFKLNGYTLTGMKQIKVKPQAKAAGLEIAETLPLSVMFQIADTLTTKAQAGTQNASVEFPQALSLFLSGALAKDIGSFIQITYSAADGHLSMDNTDIRYAGRGRLLGKNVAFGADVNNNPTVEDLWNDTPAWGYPWASSDSAPEPSAVPILAGALAGDVAGAGGYAMWDDHLYGDFTLYRSAHLSTPEPPTGAGFDFNIHDAAPYWRLAWQQNLRKVYVEVGTYGMHLASFPGAVSGPLDTYDDYAADFQLEVPNGGNLVTVHGNYIRENSDLLGSVAAGAAANARHTLNTVRLDGVYHFGNRYSAGLGWFNDSGTADALLYQAAGATGTTSGNPASSGLIAQAGYWPVQNIELMASYTYYQKFDGARFNYDGTGRNATDNNTAYLLLWLVF